MLDPLACCSYSGGRRGSGWARSERSRLEKACEASRLRMKALSAAGGLSCSSPWSTRRGAIISDSNSRSSSSSSDDVEQGRPSATKSRKRPRKAEPASSGITGGEGVGGNRLLLPTTSCNYTRFEAVDERCGLKLIVSGTVICIHPAEKRKK